MKRMLQLVGTTAAVATAAVLGATAPVSATGSTGATSVTSANTAAAPSFIGRVTARGGLAGRATPSTHTKKVAHYDQYQRVVINCKVRGTTVDDNALWYLIADHDSTQWVSARYVRNIGAAPDYCDPSDGHFNGRATTTLNQRAGASAEDNIVGRFSRGDTVAAVCYTLDGAGSRWIHTARGRWVSGRYVDVSSRLRYCMN